MADVAQIAPGGLDTMDLPFRQLAQFLPTPCWISDPEGRILWTNDAWVAYTGMDAAAIQADGFRRLHAPELYSEAQRRWAQARRRGEPVEMVFPLRGRDGGLRPFLTRVHPLRDPNGRLTGWFGVNTDISAQSEVSRARQAALQLAERLDEESARTIEAERQLDHFWEVSSDLLAIVPAAEGVPRRINAKAWERTLGYPAEQLMRTRLIDLVHRDDLKETQSLRRALNGGGHVSQFENRFRHANGHWVWLSWNVVRDGGVNHAIARDITGEVEARQALEQSERQFRLLVAGVVDYAIFMLDPNGIVSTWNAGAEHIKGYRPEEILGRHFSQFYTDADRAAGMPTRALETARREGRYEAEGWRVRKDGSLFWASVVIDAVRDEGGALIGFAKVTRDMTERRTAQIELQRARDRLAQAQKMEAIGKLTGGVAHDFNNLLMIIGGQAQLLRGRLGADDGAVSRALDAIDISTRRGQDLTRHLLAFARRQRLNPEEVRLAERAGELQRLIAASAGGAVQVSVDLPEGLWPIEADVGELDVALVNLAVNARDAMPEGGEIRLTGANTTVASGELEPDLEGDFVALTFADTGSGIPADILAKVFEPFFTTKAVDKGTGLGLSQVYGFAQQSGGAAAIESRLGEGTKITLYLPRRRGGEGNAEEAPAREGQRGVYVLLVEDNPEVAEVAAALLAQLGHRVRVAPSADVAIRMLEAGETPEVLFTDVVMAGAVDGLELARQVRRRWPRMPILLATGYSEAAGRMPAGEFPVLSKPYQIGDLDLALRGALAAAAPRRAARTRGSRVNKQG